MNVLLEALRVVRVKVDAAVLELQAGDFDAASQQIEEAAERLERAIAEIRSAAS